jgi:hypothetical protein
MDAGGAEDEGAYPRTAKPCGPDAPTLASSSQEAKLLWDDGGKQARSPGRARNRPLKPLRREGRVYSGEPVVTMLVCFFISHARPRVHWAPGFPCSPLGVACSPLF